jgi:hypothetical protein
MADVCASCKYLLWLLFIDGGDGGIRVDDALVWSRLSPCKNSSDLVLWRLLVAVKNGEIANFELFIIFCWFIVV